MITSKYIKKNTSLLRNNLECSEDSLKNYTCIYIHTHILKILSISCEAPIKVVKQESPKLNSSSGCTESTGTHAAIPLKEIQKQLRNNYT